MELTIITVVTVLMVTAVVCVFFKGLTEHTELCKDCGIELDDSNKTIFEDICIDCVMEEFTD